MKKLSLFILCGIACFSCSVDENASDAYGNFEAVEVLVAAESQGPILSLGFDEGQKLERYQIAGIIDTMQLHLKKEQLYAAERTLLTKITNLNAQIRVLEVQGANMQREFKRIESLYEDGAATQKQKDDIEGNLDLQAVQMEGVELQKQTVLAEINSLHVQVKQLEDQLQRAIVKNPIEGVVLQKYKEEGEIVAPGQSLYKVANLEELILRAYISGKQLSLVKIGQKVKVRIDGLDEMEELEGTINWISSEAEFTPKIIQTKEERVNLVYAIKVKVKNDGSLKIGMPGELKL